MKNISKFTFLFMVFTLLLVNTYVVLAIEYTQEEKNGALNNAVEQGVMSEVKRWLDEGANINGNEGTYGRTPLELAAEFDHYKIVELLIKRGAEINLIKDSGTPLHYAASKGSLSIAKLLIEKGANVNAQGEYKETPLHYAAKNGHIEMVRLLINKDANIQARGLFEKTTLKMADEHGYKEIVKLLQRKGAKS